MIIRAWSFRGQNDDIYLCFRILLFLFVADNKQNTDYNKGESNNKGIEETLGNRKSVSAIIQPENCHAKNRPKNGVNDPSHVLPLPGNKQ